MKKAIDKLQLKMTVASKQRLYAQMLRDKLQGAALDALSKEIADLNIELYVKPHSRSGRS